MSWQDQTQKSWQASSAYKLKPQVYDAETNAATGGPEQG
jgi:hypothetical protein